MSGLGLKDDIAGNCASASAGFGRGGGRGRRITRCGIFGFNWFELGMIATVIVASALSLSASALGGGDWAFALLELAAGACGILSVVLCAKGMRSGFAFGVVNAAAYAYISYVNLYFGEVMLNLGFYIPSNVASFVLWSRNESRRWRGQVQGRALSPLQLVAAVAAVLAATLAYRMLLNQLGGSMAFLDGFTTVASIAATLLMAGRFSQQWVFWIAVDVVTVALWALAGDPVMVVMWLAYLVNAGYGYLLWSYKNGARVPFKRLLARAVGE